MKSGVRDSETIALLMSGGLDSAILLGHLLKQGVRIQPIYIATGCMWQEAEQQAIERFLGRLDSCDVEPVVELEMPLADLYGDHWSMTGEKVPDQSTPDEAVFLWGRNPLLLLKAMLWCSGRGISRLALGMLESNPFADASAEFFEQFQQSLFTATGTEVQVLRPFSKMSKAEVLELGTGMPLQETFSCLAPQRGQHCGACNKCAERAHGLRSLPGGDPTKYANELRLAGQFS